jgi:serine/threonine protein phosphatase PrpC
MSRTRAPQAAAATDPGRERSNNEDRVLCEPELGIFAVIDGVGGESAGEIAAETALEVLRARLSRRTTDSARLVREAIALANRQIYERARADARLAGMSCVLTVAVLDGAKVTVGQVGDSRLYALTPGEIKKVTPDHSPVGAREDAGDLTEIEAMRHPRRNEIFRDVGSSPHEPDDARWIDVLEVQFDPAGALLLCSDGLSDMLPSRDILETVKRNAASPRAAVRALIERANVAGGKDNVSAVLIEGERFAEAVRRQRDGAAGDGRGRAGHNRPSGEVARTAAASPGSGTAAGAGRSGAAWARSSAGERRQGSLLAPLGKSLLIAALLLLAAFAAYRYREPLGRWLRDFGGRTPGSGGAAAGVLVVGTGDGGFATIGEALARARPGDTIEVAPGQYRERIALRSGVSVVSRVPRGATLLPPPSARPQGTPGDQDASGAGAATVTATEVRGARLAGFRIVGGPPPRTPPLAAGIVLDGSEVVIEEVEVTGAAGAGIESRGADHSTVRYCYVHHNAGPGIAVGVGAAPRLLSNLIAGNGIRPGAPAAGVEVRSGAAAALLADNRIEGNGGPGVVLPAPDRIEEIFRWNSFGAVPREQAVRAAAGAPAAPAAQAGIGRTVGGRAAGGGGAAAAGAAPSAAPRAPRRHP